MKTVIDGLLYDTDKALCVQKKIEKSFTIAVYVSPLTKNSDPLAEEKPARYFICETSIDEMGKESLERILRCNRSDAIKQAIDFGMPIDDAVLYFNVKDA